MELNWQLSFSGCKSFESSLESKGKVLLSKSSPHLSKPIEAFYRITPLFWSFSAHARVRKHHTIFSRNLPKTGKFPCTASIWRKNMLWPDDVTDEQLALAAAKCDEDEQTREGNENESFGFQISSCYFYIFDREL